MLAVSAMLTSTLNGARVALLALLLSGCAGPPIVASPSAAPSEASGPPLTAKQIRDPVMSRVGAYQACYDLVRADDKSLRDQFTISFIIAPDGSVESASVLGGLGVARLEDCVRRQFLRLRFPATPRGIGVRFPFAFRPTPATDTPCSTHT